MAFRIDPSSIAFLETRRGINATATIVSDEGVKIGEVDDIAEKIVADVAFVSAAARLAFVEEARLVNPIVLGRADHNDDIFASEFARALLAEAEKVLLSNM
ncbi:hypothetical protein AWB77_04613 [Caballeronia fortuita]|uniref:Uncharacterized protein n=1 Tax=Caballeronia fortuita TaxID=1777138 RepID=A0A158CX32_9BURK|nr:hypothetical protein [Caballeronia fortuita]SAK86496.1 hypothetical protein AWB77_04613 [Caballeronia fortuita]